MKISENLQAYLSKRYKNTIQYHKNKGRTIDLTFEDFIDLIKCRNKILVLNKIFNQWEANGSKGRFRCSFVLSWQSREAMLAGLVSKDTMSWVTTDRSKAVCYMKKGEKHSEAAKRKMQSTRTGRRFTTEHSQNISKALTGRTQSEEQKAKRRATWVAKKAAKAVERVDIVVYLKEVA